MSRIVINTDSRSLSRLDGHKITVDMFGLNFVASNDRWDEAPTTSREIVAGNGLAGATYDDVHYALNSMDRDAIGLPNNQQQVSISNLRYPGGTITESFYSGHALNFNSDNYASSGMQNPTDFIAICKQSGAGMTFVMPTRTFLSAGSYGSRSEAVRDAEVSTFVNTLLTKAKASNVHLNAIELGNEWWGADPMTAIEYGQVAAELARVIQISIDKFKVANSLPSSWVEPEILVQIGSRDNATLETQQIFAQFRDNTAQRAVDGLVTHRYETASFEAIGAGWTRTAIYGFSEWDRLASAARANGDMDWQDPAHLSRNVTEWNIASWSSARIAAVETGLRSYSTTLALFSELAQNGVEHADSWAVQRQVLFDLSLRTPDRARAFGGLSYTGEAFRMLNESVRGTQVVDLSADGNQLSRTDSAVQAFAGSNKVVLFVSNRTAQQNVVHLDAGDLVQGYTHAWATVVSAGEGADPLDQMGMPVITNYSGQSFSVAAGVLDFTLAAWETVRMIFTIGANGVTMAGYVDSDALVGSNYNDSISGRAGNDQLDGGNGNDFVFGGSGNDTLCGGSGNDSLIGGSGNDILSGGTGNDRIGGGDGVDTIQFWGATDIRVDLRLTSTQNTGNGIDSISGIENIKSGSGQDLLNGDGFANMLCGNDGNDTLIGWGGNDRLYGGTGSDSLSGGDGSDRLFGVYGSDTLFGGSGNDTLDGGSNADSLIGGLGNDVYLADTTLDVLVEQANCGTDRVDASVSWVLKSNFELLKLTGSNAINGTGNSVNNSIAGNSAANTLSGMSGNDILNGGNGNDTLIGGNGNDTLLGGAGADCFVFSASETGCDLIKDFDMAASGINQGDRIGINAHMLGKFAYLGGGAFTGGFDHAEARVSGNTVMIDLDANGTADISFSIQGLSSPSQLTLGDFIFV